MLGRERENLDVCAGTERFEVLDPRDCARFEKWVFFSFCLESCLSSVLIGNAVMSCWPFKTICDGSFGTH